MDSLILKQLKACLTYIQSLLFSNHCFACDLKAHTVGAVLKLTELTRFYDLLTHTRLQIEPFISRHLGLVPIHQKKLISANGHESKLSIFLNLKTQIL